MTYYPPTQGPGRPYGQPTPRITEQELEQEAIEHEHIEEARAHHPSRWRSLFRRAKDRKP